ncbi:hypothetical protein D3C87_1452460 [compost metagenome]
MRNAKTRHFLVNQGIEHVRHAIAELAHQRRFELRSILVEQRLDIAHRRPLARGTGIMRRKLQPRTEHAIVVQRFKMPPGSDRRRQIARLFMVAARQVPARGPVRRQVQCLAHQLGRSRMVTLFGQHAGIVRAPVGDHVAGRKERLGQDEMLSRTPARLARRAGCAAKRDETQANCICR